ncbi:MAG: T9SS type A sorting domain-containing protein [Saprospiraceae bacterium]
MKRNIYIILVHLLLFFNNSFSQECFLDFEPTICYDNQDISIAVFSDVEYDEIRFNCSYQDQFGDIHNVTSFQIVQNVILVKDLGPGILNFAVNLYNDNIKVSFCHDQLTLLSDTPVNYQSNIDELDVPSTLCSGERLQTSVEYICENCNLYWTLNQDYIEQDNSIQHFNTSNYAIFHSDLQIDEIGKHQLCLNFETDDCNRQECKTIEILQPEVNVSFESDDQFCKNNTYFFDNTTYLDSTVFGKGSFIWTITHDGNSYSYNSDDLQYFFDDAGDYKISLGYKIDDRPECSFERYSKLINVMNQESPINVCAEVYCVDEEIKIPIYSSCEEIIWQIDTENVLNSIIDSAFITIVLDSTFEDEFLTLVADFSACNSGSPFCTQEIFEIPIITTKTEILGPTHTCINTPTIFESKNQAPGLDYTWNLIDEQGQDLSGLLQIKNNSVEMDGFPKTGLYTLGLTVSHPLKGCASYSSLSFNVYSFETPSDYCMYDDLTFNLVGPENDNIEWRILYSNGELFKSLYSNNVCHIDNMPEGIYQIIPFIGDQLICSSSQFRVKSNTKLIINGPSRFCKQDPVLYNLNCQTNFNSFPKWELLLDGQIVKEYSGCSVQIDNLEAGNYQLISYIPNQTSNCKIIPDTAKIEVLENHVTSNIYGPESFCPDSYQTFNTDKDIKVISWSIYPPNCGSVLNEIDNDEVEILWYFVPMLDSALVQLNYVSCSDTLTIDKVVHFTHPEILLTGPEFTCINVKETMEINLEKYDEIQWYLNGEKIINDKTNYTFKQSSAGEYNITVQIKNPDGCLGLVTLEHKILVYDEPEVTWHWTGELDFCNPENFTPQYLETDDWDASFQYTWYVNNNIVKEGNGSSDLSRFLVTQELLVVESEIKLVVRNMYGCESQLYTILKCGHGDGVPIKCTCEYIEKDISLTYVDCESFSIEGTLDLALALNPQWYLLGPDGIIDSFAIQSNADLETFNYTIDKKGYYGAAFNYDCENTNPDLDELYCNFTYKEDIPFPYLENVNHEFNCGVDNSSFEVSLYNKTRYYTLKEAIVDWYFDGVTYSGDTIKINNLEPNKTYVIFLDIHYDDYFYECEDYEYRFTTPSLPNPKFELLNDCEDALIHLKPQMEESEITDLLWNFGDNSYSKIYEPEKFFGDTNYHSIELNLTDEFGCEAYYSKEIKLRENTIDGILSIDTMACANILNVTFNNQNDNEIIDYEWNPTVTIVNDTFIISEAGVYALTVTDTNGCTLELEPIIAQLKSPIPSGINTDADHCGKAIAYVTGNNNFNYQWYVDDKLKGNSTYLTINQVGNHHVLVKAISKIDDSIECASAESNIEVFPDVAMPELVEEKIACEPITFKVSEKSNLDVLWTGQNIFPGYYESILVTNSTVLTANIKNEYGCTNQAEIEILIPENNAQILNGCYNLCLDSVEQTFVIPAPRGNFGNWQWQFVDTSHQESILDEGIGIVRPVVIDQNLFGTLNLHYEIDDCQYTSKSLDLNWIDCAATMPPDTLVPDPPIACDTLISQEGVCFFYDRYCIGKHENSNLNSYYIDMMIAIPDTLEWCTDVNSLIEGQEKISISEMRYDHHSGYNDVYYIRFYIWEAEGEKLSFDFSLCNKLTGESACVHYVLPAMNCQNPHNCLLDFYNIIGGEDDNIVLQYRYVNGSLADACSSQGNKIQLYLTKSTQTTLFRELELDGISTYQDTVLSFSIPLEQLMEESYDCIYISLVDECSNVLCDSYRCGLLPNFNQMKAHIYPNPALDFVEFELANFGSGQTTLIISDHLGIEKETLVLQNSETRKVIDISNYTNGVYTVNVLMNNGHSQTLKFVKVK